MKKTIGIFGILGIICCILVTIGSRATKIDLKPTGQGGYLLYVNEKPFLIKGVGYNPTPIGKGYNYDLFADPNKPWLIDGKLMKAAGINCVTINSPGKD